MANTDPHYLAWKDQTDGTAVIRDDRYLEPHADALRHRFTKFQSVLASINSSEGSLDAFSRSYETMGLHRVKGGVRYREWAPAAKEVFLFGEFNKWDRRACPLKRDEYGSWECFIPEKVPGVSPIAHQSKVKTMVVQNEGLPLDRNPAWATYLIQDPKTYLYDTVFWNPEKKDQYQWKHADHVKQPASLRIYECHVGMGTNELKVGTYREFADKVLPHIKKTGYTALQIMAIMEHAYYASFGYHVTNFFAISSRSGTPEDIKYLIDKAHELGLYVLMDVVHSHASSNSMDGINHFDGTDHQYFHEGERGRHTLWDSRLFNYGNWEVLRFLLSNLRWYMDEYHFDGFRFDGVTSMLYLHSGIAVDFTGDYKEYFGFQTDIDACVYMMLANKLLHDTYPGVAMTVAEDVSGMPTLCVPVDEGGLGFDFRLAMAIPDMWIEMFGSVQDEDWSMGKIAFTLTNRRWNEKTIGYCESHDQALVGDKTMAFWLMDAEMYSGMSKEGYPSPTVERGISLHKMIRLVTMCLGGEGYLTFMGNEFGHPEWVDFPREGNSNSYQHARRRWDLCENGFLRYKDMYSFEIGMHKMESEHAFVRHNTHQYTVLSNEEDKVIVVEKGERLLFVFNFHPTKSFAGYRIGTYWGGRYRVVLDSDHVDYGGHGRVQWDVVHESTGKTWHERPNFLELYLPTRTCQVYHCFETWEEAANKKSAGTTGSAAAIAMTPATTATTSIPTSTSSIVTAEGTKEEVKTKTVEEAKTSVVQSGSAGAKEVEELAKKVEQGVDVNGSELKEVGDTV